MGWDQPMTNAQEVASTADKARMMQGGVPDCPETASSYTDCDAVASSVSSVSASLGSTEVSSNYVAASYYYGDQATIYVNDESTFQKAGGMTFDATNTKICEDFSGSITSVIVCNPDEISSANSCGLDSLIDGFTFVDDDNRGTVSLPVGRASDDKNLISALKFASGGILSITKGAESVRFVLYNNKSGGGEVTITVYGLDGTTILAEATVAAFSFVPTEVGIVVTKKKVAIGYITLTGPTGEAIGNLCFEKGCFPADAMVNVQGKGLTTIDQVQLGDYVQTPSGYSKVYAFAYGHNNEKEKHEYVKIETDDTATGAALELSPNHVLFVGGMSPVPKMAKDLTVGEIVQIFSDEADSKARFAKITSIKTVMKEGQYAPLTEDGTIVVNNVVASVHSIEGAAPEVKVFGITLINMHQFDHMLFAPLRLLCMFSFDDFCSADLEDEEGSHAWDSVTEHLIDMLTYDAPDLETTNFLSVSITLPFKMFVLFGMITAHVAEKVFTMNLTTILIGLVTLLYTVASLGFTIKTKKVTKKID